MTKLYVFFLLHETATDKQNIPLHTGKLGNLQKNISDFYIFKPITHVEEVVEPFKIIILIKNTKYCYKLNNYHVDTSDHF